MSQDILRVPRYEIRPCWNDGKKRFVVHDLQRDRMVVGTFDSARDASIRTTLLWFEHLRKAHRDTRRPAALTSIDTGGHWEAE
jgi:hypothetical protein